MMASNSYIARRGLLLDYFDRTAADAWARITSDAPVSAIRQTVRAGRDEMRRTLLDWMPADLSGCRVLDAGCGTGALALEAACRGAHVTAIDLSPTLIGIAKERMAQNLSEDMATHPQSGSIRFLSGDMLDRRLITSPQDEARPFDYVVAMDSLIHYQIDDLLAALAALAAVSKGPVLFSFAPRTRLLAMMHLMGRLFPRGDRAPAIEPVAERMLIDRILTDARLADHGPHRTRRIKSGFYISQALEVTRR
jgi:magnesium-protoporphyrin O-methyltransferase|nr:MULTISPECIES: magnesium protoporphyrin IX methyltransferase [unclassified Iodidimonas]